MAIRETDGRGGPFQNLYHTRNRSLKSKGLGTRVPLSPDSFARPRAATMFNLIDVRILYADCMTNTMKCIAGNPRCTTT